MKIISHQTYERRVRGGFSEIFYIHSPLESSEKNVKIINKRRNWRRKKKCLFGRSAETENRGERRKTRENCEHFLLLYTSEDFLLQLHICINKISILHPSKDKTTSVNVEKNWSRARVYNSLCIIIIFSRRKLRKLFCLHTWHETHRTRAGAASSINRREEKL